MGRPIITLDAEQVREVETLAALLNQDQIADYLGIARNTFRAICARDEEVAARYKKGKAKAIAHVANGLLQKARAGDTTCAIFYLKTQAGWVDTPKAQAPGVHEASTNGGKDTLQQMLDEIAERGARIGCPAEPPQSSLAAPEDRNQ